MCGETLLEDLIIRLRPDLAGTIRNCYDKTPFLTHVTPIGRNFDDERTPLDGVSGPRRTISDESIRVPVVGLETSLDYVVQSNRPVSNHGSYAARFAEGVSSQSRMGYQNVGGGSIVLAMNPSLNPWALRKEAVVEDQVLFSWSAPNAGTKLANASALEKVSSGRWHSKQLSDNNQVDIEVRRDLHKPILVRQMEKSLIVDDGICAGGKASPVYERAVPSIDSEVQENRIYDDGHQPSRIVEKFVRSELQYTLHPESSERPKLNLLPRSRPSETVEPSPTNYEQSQR